MAQPTRWVQHWETSTLVVSLSLVLFPFFSSPSIKQKAEYQSEPLSHRKPPHFTLLRKKLAPFLPAAAGSKLACI
jgi:hypothetical protein